MLEELAKLVFEEIIGAAFAGIFRHARSRQPRTLKFAAWIALISSVILFVVAATTANGQFVILAVVSGTVSTLCFFVFGIWASVANARVEHNGDE